MFSHWLDMITAKGQIFPMSSGRWSHFPFLFAWLCPSPSSLPMMVVLNQCRQRNCFTGTYNKPAVSICIIMELHGKTTSWDKQYYIFYCKIYCMSCCWLPQVQCSPPLALHCRRFLLVANTWGRSHASVVKSYKLCHFYLPGSFYVKTIQWCQQPQLYFTGS